MIVRLAIRMLSAISLGVLCRFAPSTRAIMRSRKVSPGLALIRTTIQSESTRVPPVTALRSPPLSRMTGADSPVMADSSTEATPSCTSPSPGITSPASTSTRSPLRKSGAATSWTLLKRSGLESRLAMVVERARRKVSAWALPRPSAIASAKLAKTTVNHNQKATASTKIVSDVSRLRVKVAVGVANSKRTNSIVVITLPTSTTNMTGFLICTRGSSFLKESGIAPRMILGSQIEMSPLRRVFHCLTSSVSVCKSVLISECSPLLHQQLFDNRPQRVRREVGQRPHNQDHANQQGHEERTRRREGTQPGRHGLLPHQRACEAQDQQGRDQQGENRHHDLLALDLLAQVLRRAPHHQPSDEDRDDGEVDHAVESCADAPKDDLTQRDVGDQHQPANRRIAIVEAHDCTRRGGCCGHFLE